MRPPSLLLLVACGGGAPPLDDAATVRSCDGLLPNADVAAAIGVEHLASWPYPGEWLDAGWECSRTWSASPIHPSAVGLELLQVVDEADAPRAVRWLLGRFGHQEDEVVETEVTDAPDLGDGGLIRVDTFTVHNADHALASGGTEVFAGFTSGTHAGVVVARWDRLQGEEGGSRGPVRSRSSRSTASPTPRPRRSTSGPTRRSTPPARSCSPGRGWRSSAG